MATRVLIAEDNPSMRKVIRSFVERELGFEVCAESENGTDAADQAIALCPDLVVLDFRMPGLNGIEVASVLKKSLPNAKTVLFTMYGQIIGETLARAAGVNVVLPKAQGLPALARTLRSLSSQELVNFERAVSKAIKDEKTAPRHLDSLTRALKIPLTRCSRDFKYLWVNQHYADWLQKPVEKIAGRSILNILGRDAFNSLRHRFEQALTGEDVTYEAEVDYDGIGRRRICAAYKATHQKDGVPDGWIAFVHDITDSQLACAS